MRRCSRGNGDQDHEKRNERSIQRRGSDRGKEFTIAIENKGKRVDYLVADKRVPSLYGAKGFSTLATQEKENLQLRMG